MTDSISSEDEKVTWSNAEDSGLDNIALVKSGNRSCIYKCTKPELLSILEDENISYKTSASVDNLRKLLSNYYKRKLSNKKQESTPSLQSNIGKMSTSELKQFDGEKWEVFIEQFECYVLVNDIGEVKKIPLLITKLTPRVFETLTYLCSPIKPTKKTFEELCKLLKDKYAKPLSSALEKIAFRKRNQLPNEKILEYSIELRKLAARCNFKDAEDQIKEKFIEGVHSKIIKFELMKSETEQSLEKCIEVARTVEAALLHSDSPSEVTEIFYSQGKVKPVPRQKNKFNNNRQSNNVQCFCCGKQNHIKAECSLKRKFCSECGQQGHIYRMCPRKQRQTNVLEVEPENKNESEDAVSSIKELYEEYETYTFNSMLNNQ
ncbi:uncharacterized protein [Choristoneura fumiferana]|uniref:uncharacterized protein n=1 Tax=Choristoneura fumiferana TaxID=7141 RepID=UPI003D155BEA